MTQDPNQPPPIPAGIPVQRVRTGDGERVEVVSIDSAAKLMGVGRRTVEQWIGDGKVITCDTPDHEVRIFVPSLWQRLPVQYRL